jgi:hypothetical protein
MAYVSDFASAKEPHEPDRLLEPVCSPIKTHQSVYLKLTYNFLFRDETNLPYGPRSINGGDEVSDCFGLDSDSQPR